MSRIDFNKLSTQFAKYNIVVVGDVFLDKYTHGIVRGTSRETPVPLYEFEDQITTPGAAGNVACNFAALGTTVHVVGFIGKDEDSEKLVSAFKERGVRTGLLIELASSPTNSYEKLLARAPNGKPQEILLIQKRLPHNGEIKKGRAKILPRLRKLSRSLDAIVVVDQISHLCDRSVFGSIASFCRKLNILSVGNSREQIRSYQGFDYLVVNELEAASARLTTKPDFLQLGKALLPQVRRGVLLTTGPDGMRLFEKNSPPIHHRSVARQIVDVTGAGDTALAAFVCSRLSNLPKLDVLLFSSAAAAVSIAKPGTATATIKEIAACL